MGNTMLFFLYVSLAIACLLFYDLPMPVAGVEVIESKCTEEQFQAKDKMCARTFLEKVMKQGANCSDELKKFKMCFKNFTLDCYGNFLTSYPNMSMAMGRMADIKSMVHHFAGMMCGMPHGPINTTGLSEKIKHLLKGKPEFYDQGKTCAEPFFSKFKMKMNNSSSLGNMPELCDSFKKAKKCNGDLMKKHCSHNKPPPLDKFNPFCPNKQDRPDPTSGGNEKAIISGILSLITFAFFFADVT